MKVTRTRLRDLTMKIVYQYDFYKKPDLEDQMNLFLEQQEDLAVEDIAEISARAMDILAKIPELDKAINENTEGWTVSRMNRVDLSVIRLALYEMRYDDEVPLRVAINEAVDLAREYGGDESPKFVNGVLAKFAKETNE